MGCAENKVGGRGRPKMAREASIYRRELGFEGLGAFLDPPIAIPRLRSEGGLGGLQEGLVGCVEERKRGAARWQFQKPKRPTIKPATVPLRMTVGLSNGLRMR